MAVDAENIEPVTVERDLHAVTHQLPETGIHLGDLTGLAGGVDEAHVDAVQVRAAVVPQLRGGDAGEREGGVAIGFRGAGLRCNASALRIGYDHFRLGAGEISGVLGTQPHIDGDGSRLQIVAQQGTYGDVVHMDLGQCHKLHGAEDAEETEKVLVFDPCRGRAFEHLACDGVGVGLVDIRGQVEFGRREGVFRISDEMPVEPQVERLLHAFEHHVDALAAHMFGQGEGAHVGADRIVVGVGERADAGIVWRQAGRAAILTALPRVHGVDVLVLVISRHFDMPRHCDVVEVGGRFG